MLWPTYPSHRTSSHLIAAHTYPWYLCRLPLFCEGTFSCTHLWIRSDFRIPLIQLSLEGICSPCTPVLTSHCHCFAIGHIPISHLISSPGVFATSLSPSQRDVSSNFVDSADIWTTLIHLNTYDFVQDFRIVYCIFVPQLLPYYFSASSIHGHVFNSTLLSTHPIASLFLAKGYFIERISMDTSECQKHNLVVA